MRALSLGLRVTPSLPVVCSSRWRLHCRPAAGARWPAAGWAVRSSEDAPGTPRQKRDFGYGLFLITR